MRKLRCREIGCSIHGLTAIRSWDFTSLIHTLNHFASGHLVCKTIVLTSSVSLSYYNNYARVLRKHSLSIRLGIILVNKSNKALPSLVKMVLWTNAKGWDFAPQRPVVEVPAPRQEETTMRLVSRKDSGVLRLETVCAKARGHAGFWPFQRAAAPGTRGGSCKGWPGQIMRAPEGMLRRPALQAMKSPGRAWSD